MNELRAVAQVMGLGFSTLLVSGRREGGGRETDCKEEEAQIP